MRFPAGQIFNTSGYMNRLSQSFPPDWTIWLNGTDYYAECNVANGTDTYDDDFVTLMKTVIAQLPNGGHIHLRKGTYEADVENVAGGDQDAMVLTEGVTISGSGVKNTVIKSVGTMQDEGTWLFEMHADTCMRDMTLDFNTAGLTWGPSYVPNSWYGSILVGNANGMATPPFNYPATHALVDNIYFKNHTTPAGVNNSPQGWALNLMQGKGITARHVSFENNDVGLFVTYQPDADPTTHLYADNHYLIDDLYGTDNSKLIYHEIGSAIYNNIRGELNTYDFYMNATDTYTSYATIHNFWSRASTSNAVVLGAAGTPVIVQGSDWFIKNSGSSAIINNGVDTTDINLTNLHIDGADGNGINQTLGGHFSINGGVIKNCNEHGATFTPATAGSVSMSGVTVKDNNQDGAPGLYGVYLSAANSRIENCTIKNTSAASPTQLIGIFLDDCLNSVLMGNVILNHASVAGYGVYESGTTDYVTLVGNNLRGNSTAHNVGAAHDIIEHNQT